MISYFIVFAIEDIRDNYVFHLSLALHLIRVTLMQCKGTYALLL